MFNISLKRGPKRFHFLLLSFFFLAVPVFKAHAFVQEDKISTSKSLAHYTMGQIYDLLGLPEAATLEYEKAAQFDESSYIIHLRLGVGYARLNMLPEAKEELKRSQAINGEDLQSHYVLALIYSAERDYDSAAAEYEIILKQLSQSEPKNVAIYGYLAQLYYSQHKFEQAIKQYEKVLELEPDNPDVMYLLGSLYYDQKDPSKAINILKHSIDLSPDHDGSLNTLGYIYVEQNENLDEAIKLINRALDVEPNNGAYLDSLGWAYYKKGKYNEALSTLIKADTFMQDAAIKDHLGDVYLKLNKTDEAIKSWESSLKLVPSQPEVVKKLDQIRNSQAQASR